MGITEEEHNIEEIIAEVFLNLIKTNKQTVYSQIQEGGQPLKRKKQEGKYKAYPNQTV